MAPQIKKWGPEVTKTLVALYELQPTLYQTTSPSYHNKVLRLKCLEHIVTEINNMYKTCYTVDDVTKKVNNLRTQFLDVYRSCKGKEALRSGMSSDDVQKPTWWLYESMQFLVAYCKKDKGKSNLPKKPAEVQELPEMDNWEETNDYSNNTLELSVDTEVGNTVDDGGLVSPAISVASSSKSVEIVPRPPTSKPPRKGQKGDAGDFHQVITKAVEDLNNEKPAFPPDVESLCNFIGVELLNLKKKANYKKCKWEILDVIRKIQEQEEEDHE